MNQTTTELLSIMTQHLLEAEIEAGKHEAGNAAAGRRLRNIMQSVKGLAQEVRTRVTADKAAR